MITYVCYFCHFSLNKTRMSIFYFYSRGVPSFYPVYRSAFQVCIDKNQKFFSLTHHALEIYWKVMILNFNEWLSTFHGPPISHELKATR